MAPTDLILDALDITDGKFGFADTCPIMEQVEFFVVPFRDIQVNIEGDAKVIKCDAHCDKCGASHMFILYKSW